MKFLFILLALSSMPVAAEVAYRINTPDQKTVEYDGEIVRGSHQALLPYLLPEVERLKISSAGGNVEEAILIATEIRKKNIQLQVDGICLSSCANYLFLGASSKSLGPHAILGFHGSPGGQLSPENLALFQKGQLKSADITGDGLRNYVTRLALTELEFLQSIHVDRGLFKEINGKLIPVIEQKKQVPQKSGFIILTTSDKRWEYSPDEIDAAMEKALALEKDGNKVGIQIEIQLESAASNLAYFPDRAILEKHGVKGILSYSYPKDASELKQRTLDSLGDGVNIFGDF